MESAMELLYTNASVSISELKKNPTAVIEEADGFPVAVLNHNKPAAYLVPAAAFEAMMEKLDDIELARLVKAREKERTVKVELDDL
jgi:antitoxin StbD